MATNAVTDRGYLTCLEGGLHVATVATVINSANGAQSSAVGSVSFVRNMLLLTSEHLSCESVNS